MRVLLIACDFPPTPSPQSLRWMYLTRELAALGHEIHVLAPKISSTAPVLSVLHECIHVHRVFPGVVRQLLSVLRSVKIRRPTLPPTHAHTISRSCYWKKQISKMILHIAQYLYYPDIRGEWFPWAQRALRRLLREIKPDIVISSHEPATSLELGLLAKKSGFYWVADIGDPVLASYTPAHWKKRAHTLERCVLQQADLVTLTNPAAAALLSKRHPHCAPCMVIPQGFEQHLRDQHAKATLGFDPARLELLYTGSFYAFRSPDALIQAVQAQSGVRLTIMTNTIPARLLEAARRMPDKIRLFSAIPHATALMAQRHVDVLVNIANQEMSQIPGKFNEYLGAQRPILHLSSTHGAHDPMASDIASLRRGWICENHPNAISTMLNRLYELKTTDRLGSGLELGLDSVMERSWLHLAKTLASALDDIHHGHLRDVPHYGVMA